MRHVLEAIVLILLAAGSVDAQVIAGNFDQLRVLVKSGDTLTVTDGGGTRSRGRLIDVAASSFELDIAGTRRLFQDIDVNLIEKRSADSLRNGALIGLAIGGGVFGLAIGTATRDWGLAVGGGLIYAGIGAGIGVGIDALIEGERVIYTASRPKPTLNFAPTFGRAGRGVVLSVNLWR